MILELLQDLRPLNCGDHGRICNLLRPLIKILFLLVPYGYIVLKIKRIPKEMTGIVCRGHAGFRTSTII